MTTNLKVAAAVVILFFGAVVLWFLFFTASQQRESAHAAKELEVKILKQQLADVQNAAKATAAKVEADAKAETERKSTLAKKLEEAETADKNCRYDAVKAHDEYLAKNSEEVPGQPGWYRHKPHIGEMAKTIVRDANAACDSKNSATIVRLQLQYGAPK